MKGNREAMVNKNRCVFILGVGLLAFVDTAKGGDLKKNRRPFLHSQWGSVGDSGQDSKGILLTMNNQAKDKTSRFEVHPTVETHFSFGWHCMSAERTLMSWVRTATVLIGLASRSSSSRTPQNDGGGRSSRSTRSAALSRLGTDRSWCSRLIISLWGVPRAAALPLE